MASSHESSSSETTSKPPKRAQILDTTPLNLNSVPAEFSTVFEYLMSGRLADLSKVTASIERIEDWKVTDQQLIEFLAAQTRPDGPHIHPKALSFTSKQTKKNNPIDNRENTDYFARFMRLATGGKNVRVGLLDTWPCCIANKTAEEMSKMHWYATSVALINNPDNKKGKHLIIFAIDAHSQWTNFAVSFAGRPLCERPSNVLQQFRPREWLEGPVLQFYRHLKEVDKVNIQSVWLGDAQEKEQGLCMLTTARFVQDMVRRGDKPFDPEDPFLKSFRRFGYA